MVSESYPLPQSVIISSLSLQNNGSWWYLFSAFLPTQMRLPLTNHRARGLLGFSQEDHTSLKQAVTLILEKLCVLAFNTFIRKNSKLKVGNHLRIQCSGVLWSTMFRKIFIPILINVFRSQSVGHNLATEHQQLFDRYPSKWFLVTHLLLQKIVWVM